MKRLLILAGIGALPLAASAAPLFAETFDVDATANWQFNSSVVGDTATNNSNNEANFFFDYSTVGIPSAPNSIGGTTLGLKMEANVFGTTTGVFSGMSASPLGQSFSGDYTLTFDAWQNFQGPFPGGGSGTTQLTFAGIGVPTNEAQFPANNIDGVGFAATGDGGSLTDYRAYTNVGAPLGLTPGVYAAGTGTSPDARNSDHPYYAGFQGTVPADQTTFANGQGFTLQTGSTRTGALGMDWHTWEIAKVGGTITWSVDGLLFATVTNAENELTGDNIFLGYFDSNTGTSADAISRSLLFAVVDNVQVNAAPVPEPATMAILGLGAAALLRRRSRR